MLVEDDNNLREIYEARLAAEGYEIISAADGEAALALAIKEKPDLIISDIMMPKVSGFDMLDILRSTTETKHTKIIMMTALNQAEDKIKAEELGADLYLVKSQVTLEDVVRSAKNLLGEETPLSIGEVPVQQPVVPSPAMTQNATSLSANAPTVQIPTTQPTIPTTVNNIAPPSPLPQPVVASNPIQTAQLNQTTQPIVPSEQIPQPQVATSIPNSAQQPIVSNQTMSPEPITNTMANETVVPATSIVDQEQALKEQIEQYISDDPNQPKQQPVTQDPVQVIPPKQPTTQTVPVSISSTESTTTVPATAETNLPPNTTSTSNPQPIPSSMAQPPSTLDANTPSEGDPNADRPAGEQVLAKNASADVTTKEPAIDASISGRKKVIQPINDILTTSSNLEALVAKDIGPDITSPELNSIVTPGGVTLSATNGTPTMNDIIVPNQAQPQSQQNQVPQQPQQLVSPTNEASLPPPVA